MIVRKLISLLVVCNCFISGAWKTHPIHENGEKVEITCKPSSSGTIVFWFRILKTGFEFLGSVTSQGTPKVPVDGTVFSVRKKEDAHILVLKSFQEKRDSGFYSCGILNNNKVFFGATTIVKGHPVPTTTVAIKNIHTTPDVTTQPCLCKNSDKIQSMPSGGCPVVVWAPLTAACGLIFFILILIICHCNRIRTRRCPHHYKRKPKNTTPARQAMVERYR